MPSDSTDLPFHCASKQQLQSWEADLKCQLQQLKTKGLKLDLTRGKPGDDQLSLSNSLDGILANDYLSAAGIDVRNYGGLDGLPEAKALFAQVLGVEAQNMLIGGNSSLTLMYQAVQYACFFGLMGKQSAWRKPSSAPSKQQPIKFLCPVPGYDRHFSICEEFGIEMLPVAMTETGPDMDTAESLVKQDPTIKGIWCVPRFSNPTGTVYSDDTVDRIARLPTIAGDNFLILWDNAYAIHHLEASAPSLSSIFKKAQQHGTDNNLVQFASTSKVTFAGAGVAYMAASEAILNGFKQHFGISAIGPDKVNQLRHVKLFKNLDSLSQHMDKHAAILAPRFNAVLNHLQNAFGENGNQDMGSWTTPKGGYFISFDTLPGLAQRVVNLASETGVKLTPAGATFPYGRDPENKNIRLAPSYPSVKDINSAMEVFVVCVKLASVEHKLASA